MKKIVLLFFVCLAAAIAAAAQAPVSREKGRHYQVSVEFDRGFGAGINAGISHSFGNGFVLTWGHGGEWNQRPNAGGNVFVTGFGEAKYAFLPGIVSPYLATRLKLRYKIPGHLKEGLDLGDYYRVATQFDLFGLGLAGLDWGRFSLWGGLGGGPSFFHEEHKDPETLRVTSSEMCFGDISYCFGITCWF